MISCEIIAEFAENKSSITAKVRYGKKLEREGKKLCTLKSQEAFLLIVVFLVFPSFAFVSQLECTINPECAIKNLNAMYETFLHF